MVEILSDVLVVTNTETFTRTVQFRTTENGQVTMEDVNDTGTYTRDGPAITLFQEAGASITGSVSGNTITLSEEGFVFVYRR